MVNRQLVRDKQVLIKPFNFWISMMIEWNTERPVQSSVFVFNEGTTLGSGKTGIFEVGKRAACFTHLASPTQWPVGRCKGDRFLKSHCDSYVFCLHCQE